MQTGQNATYGSSTTSTSDYKETSAAVERLVTLHNERIEGYRRALDDTDDADLKMVFTNYADQSRQYKDELLQACMTNGLQVDTNENKILGQLHKMWMDIKGALTDEDRHAVLASCESGDDVILDAYKDALNDNDAPLHGSVRQVITTQLNGIQAAHDKIKSLRDAAA